MMSAYDVGGALAAYLVSLPALTFVLENAYSPQKQERMWARHYERLTFQKYVSLAEFKKYGLKGFDGRTSRAFSSAVVVHNAALAVFSAYLFFGSIQVSFQMFANQGFGSLCDPWTWDHYYIDYWATLFYWSKYYEFLDTWVIIAKSDRYGKRAKPSLLQVYHHCGIVVCTWATTVNRAPWAIYTVALNSGVHTFMYSYFLARCLGFGGKMAKYVTTIQLTQFVVGLAMGLYSYSCSNGELQQVCVVYLVYVVGLLVLFSDLFRKKYTSKQKI
jgi:hypothetical protein